MNAQLNYTMVQHRSDELRRARERARERARIATEAPASRRRSRDQNTITHPSAERERRTIALELERTIGGAR
jgi:hypothetical protein